MAAAAPSIDQIKSTMRSTWMAGDFGVIAKNAEKGGEDFVQRLNLPAGARVLDVACGTGNVTIPLAQQGFTVTGVDIAPNLLEQARDRAAALGLQVQFDEGDAEQLPYPDGSFDAVVTMFGAMFAPRPDVVAKELARVLKPTGLLAMGNWNPAGFSGKMFKTGAMHAPPPPGIQPPVLWGDEATVCQRLQGAFSDVRTELVPMKFDFAMNVEGVIALFRNYFGPTMMAFTKLDEAGQKAFHDDLVALWSGANVATDPEQHVLVRNEYLMVTATRA